MQAVLHYIYDPLCGWCYAASPMVQAVTEAGIPVVLHGGGLWSSPTRIEPTKRAAIRQYDAQIAALTGVRFGDTYLNGLLSDPDTVFWSRPVTAAVLAAGSDGPRMLHAVQHAHYVEGQRVVEQAVLVELGAAIGLLPAAFERAIAGAAVDAHIGESRSLMARAGIGGFPGFLLERDGHLARVGHEPFYGRPDDFVRAIAA